MRPLGGSVTVPLVLRRVRSPKRSAGVNAMCVVRSFACGFVVFRHRDGIGSGGLL